MPFPQTINKDRMPSGQLAGVLASSVKVYPMTRIPLTLIFAALGLSLLSSCGAGTNNPGRAYAPDMYYSQAYETYSPSTLSEDGLSAFLPAENTVPFGRERDAEATLGPWPFPNVGDADTFSIMPAMNRYANPMPLTEAGLAEGQKNYGIYCAICHGGDGLGKGYLVSNTTYAQVPANLMEDRFLYGASDAWLYHVLQYGKNSMGSYAYAMTREQRWEVVNYIRALQMEYLAKQEKDAEQAAADAMAAEAADPSASPAEDAGEGEAEGAQSNSVQTNPATLGQR